MRFFFLVLMLDKLLRSAEEADALVLPDGRDAAVANPESRSTGTVRSLVDTWFRALHAYYSNENRTNSLQRQPQDIVMYQGVERLLFSCMSRLQRATWV